MPPIAMTDEWLLWDLETDGLLDNVTKIHCAVVINLKTGVVDQYRPHQIKQALQRICASAYNTGHNIMRYDWKVVAKLYPEYAKPLGRCSDTLYVSRLVWANLRRDDWNRVNKGDTSFPKHLCGLHSLEAWGYRFGEHKGDYSKMMKARGLDPWASFNEDMLAYCVQDVKVNLRLWKLIASKKPDPRSVRLEHDIADIIDRQEQWGVGFDVIKAAKLYGVLAQKRDELLEQCRTLFPKWIAPDPKPERIKKTVRRGRGEYGKRIKKRYHKISGARLKDEEIYNVYESFTEGDWVHKFKVMEFNPGSRHHVADRLQKIYGWIPVEFNAPDDDDDGGDLGQPKITDEILGNLDYPAAKLLAEFYVVQKRLGMISEGKNAWLTHERDGKIYGRVNTQGTPTGRATHSKPNLGQVPSLTNAKGTVPYGKECRELFKPTRKGWVQVGADASGLELRCLGHELHPYDDGAYADIVLNGDIHWTNAILLGLVPHGTTRDDHIKLHKEARAIAKRFIYAFLYGGGAEMIGSIAGVTEADIKKYGTNSRIKGRILKDGRHPDPALIAMIAKGEVLMKKFLENLPALKELKAKIAAELKELNGHLRGLDGRLLPSRSAHSALNLLLQSDGAIICKRWIVQAHTDLEAAGFKWGVDYAQMLWVHDEIQIECRPEIAEDVARIVREAVPKVADYFDFRVRLDGEAMIGGDWAECH
ncbi:DNA polymerase [Rhizobium leguminosarum]|uniref:DNA polymerase n=1 Tax=Rhizobium leguminosarum TaxID=384 RepID=UPI00047FBED6|nr:DNA polymerase [Rhizobium leguminosarum]